jgi:hypothetical protein
MAAPNRAAPTISPLCQRYWNTYCAEHNGQLPGRNGMVKALASAEVTPWRVRRDWERLTALHRDTTLPTTTHPEGHRMAEEERETRNSLIPQASDDAETMTHRLAALEAFVSGLARQQSQDSALQHHSITSIERLEVAMRGLTAQVADDHATAQKVQLLLETLAQDEDSWHVVWSHLRQDGIGGKNRFLRELGQQVNRKVKILE